MIILPATASIGQKSQSAVLRMPNQASADASKSAYGCKGQSPTGTPSIARKEPMTIENASRTGGSKNLCQQSFRRVDRLFRGRLHRSVHPYRGRTGHQVPLILHASNLTELVQPERSTQLPETIRGLLALGGAFPCEEIQQGSHRRQQAAP